jgi:diguanylate cyclase (GGDEF)-like protein
LSYYYGTAVHRAQIDLEEKNRQLDELSRTDPLTELSNRREAVAILEYECARSLRASDRFAIALVDIDHFKSINDDYGHDTGDRVLRELALLLRSSLRAQDSIARWGGEEFLMILPQTGTDGARTVAEKVRQAVAERIHQCGDASFSVTVTIGIAIYDHDASLEQVIRDADESLYRGKDCGRNQVCCSWDQS